MHSRSITTILLLVVAVLCEDCEACNSPLEVKKVHDDHYTVIQCSYSGIGTDVSNATFFRNGLDMYADDCVVSYDPTNSMLNLKPVSFCDGFYRCGKDCNLSEPLPIYSKPVQNGPGNGKNIEITLEEGANKTLPCHVSTSPINTQITTWYNGVNELEDHNKDESSYRIVNAAMGVHNGLYWCSVESVTFKFQDKPVVDSNPNGTFKVTVVKKFTPATFTESLTYIIDDEGTAHFSSSADYNEEYRVNYQWYINDSVVDKDELSQTGKLQFELEKIANYEETKVRVVIWNTKYDNVNHSDSQTIAIHWNLQACPIPPSTPSPSTTITLSVAGEQDNDAQTGLIIGLAVSSALVLVLVAVILLLSMMLYARGSRPTSKPSDLELSQLRKQSLDDHKKSLVHSDSAGPEPISHELLEVLKMITVCTRERISSGLFNLDFLILKCLRELIESICNTEEIDIDGQTADMLGKAYQILHERSIRQIGTFQQQLPTTPNGKVADNEENRTQKDKENKGNIQMDGEKKGNTIQLDGDCHCIREKDISHSKLIIEQELLSEILQNIEKKLEQFRQKDGDL